MSKNVLCLHGCNMTEAVFRSCMGNVVSICGKGQNFFFTEALYDHPAGGKTWYNKPLVLSDIGKEPYSRELVIEAISSIEKEIEEKNIDTLLGFSQGGNVVDVYLKHFNTERRIRKAVILSSYSLVDDHEPVVSDVPVCIVGSDSDTIVPFELYPKNYEKTVFVKHDKGHKIPNNPVIREIKKFLDE